MVHLGEGGRIVIPAAYRRALEVEPGDELVLTMTDGELRIATRDRAIARAQAIVRKYASEGESLVDELIDERRAEAESD
jgi:AbrB family looped-hinge helix DNA binding protein